MDISDVAGKDRPVEFNEKGGGQSSVPVRFDLVDGKAMFRMCAVLHEGAEKYGDNNWRKIDIEDHLNHLIMHAYAYLAGDRSDEHLSHIMCRAMFAQAVEITDHDAKTTRATMLRNIGVIVNNVGQPIGYIDELEDGTLNTVLDPDNKQLPKEQK